MNEHTVASTSGRLPIWLFNALLKSSIRPELAVTDGHLNRSRKSMDRWGEWMPRLRRVMIQPGTHAGLYCETHIPSGVHSNRIILYFHGGGFAVGSPRSHRHLVSRLAQAAGMKAIAIEYRKAPEHPYPAALDDTTRAYRQLLDQGYRPEHIVLAGDSAGGNLTLTTLLRLRDEGVPLPAAACAISPWCDVTLALPSIVTNAARDLILSPLLLQQFRDLYVNSDQQQAPQVSPLFADLTGLPPLLLQVGSDEVLLDDARQLARRAARAGVPVTLEVWEGMQHVWHYSALFLQDGRRALARIGEFFRQQQSGA